MNYNELEDEEDANLKLQGSTLPLLSSMLPVDEDDEIDICSDEHAEILADRPIPPVKKSKVTEKAGVVKVDSKDGGVFELNIWV